MKNENAVSKPQECPWLGNIEINPGHLNLKPKNKTEWIHKLPKLFVDFNAHMFIKGVECDFSSFPKFVQNLFLI